MHDIDARIVSFTTDEVQEIVAMLHTIKSPAAVKLAEMAALRSVYAVADSIDNEDEEEEPYDASHKLSNVRSYPGMSGVPVTREKGFWATHIENPVTGEITEATS